MDGDLPQANAHFIGLKFMLLVTGAYFCYIPRCISVLRTKFRQGLPIWLPAACILMFVITVIDLCVETSRGSQAFFTKGHTRPNPTEFYADPSTPLAVLKNTLNVVVSITSDTIMVYRTFLIWHRNRAVVLFPLGVLFANIAIAIWAIWTLIHTDASDSLIYADVTRRTCYAFALTFCVHIICASLICIKLWRALSRVRRVSHAPTGNNVLGVIIASAGLYCAYLLILIVTSSVGSNVFFIFLDPLPQVTALLFTFLIVHAQTDAPKEPQTPHLSSIRFWERSQASNTARPSQSGDLGEVSSGDTVNALRGTKDVKEFDAKTWIPSGLQSIREVSSSEERDNQVTRSV
ncbi:hypothetical protein BD413DRAFT_166953 [Trametes elegans]|nr:hypothetical protein BD413DRAFT_166953 [Trametes elegans]